MKDGIGLAVFILAIALVSLIEDYRAERCADHGGAWVKRHGCSSDYCDRSRSAP